MTGLKEAVFEAAGAVRLRGADSRRRRSSPAIPGPWRPLSGWRRFTPFWQSGGLADYVTYDLGMLSNYRYYTGIIFKAYTYGTGDYIVTGGRYDKLLVQFGKDAPAVGFVIVVDQLMAALSRQQIDVPVVLPDTVILYEQRRPETGALWLAELFPAAGSGGAVHEAEHRPGFGGLPGYGEAARACAIFCTWRGTAGRSRVMDMVKGSEDIDFAVGI